MVLSFSCPSFCGSKIYFQLGILSKPRFIMQIKTSLLDPFQYYSFIRLRPHQPKKSTQTAKLNISEALHSSSQYLNKI